MMTNTMNNGTQGERRGRRGRRLALAAGAVGLVATLTGTGLGMARAHAETLPNLVTLSVQGPSTVEGGFTVRYTWTVAASSGTGALGLNLQVTGLLNPQFSYSGTGAGNFSCQPGVGVSDFYRQCDGYMETGQTATFTVTGQAPLSGTIYADGSMNIGTQTVANVFTTVTPPIFHRL